MNAPFSNLQKKWDNATFEAAPSAGVMERLREVRS